ncbi:MAG: hypothetical protein GX418_08825 [Clostridiales bacterium]|nr:hypothetical protein [Clostridiales bacterium]
MRNYRGNALLIELVIALLFFALSQAIILRVFADAQTTNADARAMTRALAQAGNVAETLRVSEDAEATLRAFGFQRREDERAQAGGYALQSADGYLLTAAITRFSQPAGLLTTVRLSAWRDGAELFSLPAVRYQGVAVP